MIPCVDTAARWPGRRIQGFPTIKAWVNGKPAGEYSGDRSAFAIKDWALRLLPDRVATVNKQSQACASMSSGRLQRPISLAATAALGGACPQHLRAVIACRFLEVSVLGLQECMITGRHRRFCRHIMDLPPLFPRDYVIWAAGRERELECQRDAMLCKLRLMQTGRNRNEQWQ